VTNEERATQITEVLSCEDRRCEAIVQRDLAALDVLLSDDLAYVHSNGMVDTKDDYLTIVKSYRFKSIRHSEMQVKLDGSLAILRAITAIDAMAADGSVLAGQLRTINVWERTNSRWQQLHWQAVKAGLPAHSEDEFRALRLGATSRSPTS
jgi:ketosteroid isomerase-like protein